MTVEVLKNKKPIWWKFWAKNDSYTVKIKADVVIDYIENGKYINVKGLDNIKVEVDINHLICHNKVLNGSLNLNDITKLIDVYNAGFVIECDSRCISDYEYLIRLGYLNKIPKNGGGYYLTETKKGNSVILIIENLFRIS